MAYFVKLTDFHSDQNVFVNLELATTITSKNAGTVIRFGEAMETVKETPEVIHRMMRTEMSDF